MDSGSGSEKENEIEPNNNVIELPSEYGDDLAKKTDKLKCLLNDLGMEPKGLSDSGKKNLEALSEISALLMLADETVLESSVMYQRMQQKIYQHEQINREIALRKKQVEVINKKINNIHKKFEQLKNVVSSVDQGPQSGNGSQLPSSAVGATADVSQKQTQYQYLASKCSKYSTQIAHLRRRLDISAKSYSHPRLTARGEHLTQLRKEISSIKAELDTYIQFPADINLAKVKLEEAKRQLELLDQDLTLKMDLKNT